MIRLTEFFYHDIDVSEIDEALDFHRRFGTLIGEDECSFLDYLLQINLGYTAFGETYHDFENYCDGRNIRTKVLK